MTLNDGYTNIHLNCGDENVASFSRVIFNPFKVGMVIDLRVRNDYGSLDVEENYGYLHKKKVKIISEEVFLTVTDNYVEINYEVVFI